MHNGLYHPPLSDHPFALHRRKLPCIKSRHYGHVWHTYKNTYSKAFWGMKSGATVEIELTRDVLDEGIFWLTASQYGLPERYLVESELFGLIWLYHYDIKSYENAPASIFEAGWPHYRNQHHYTLEFERREKELRACAYVPSMYGEP